MKPTIHVVFNMSAAGSIRQALGIIGCTDHVFGFPDNLSYGAINAPTVEERQESLSSITGFDLDEVVDFAELFWADVTLRDVLPVVWVCRSAAADHAGLLEFMRRIGDQSFRVLDVSGIEVVGHEGPLVPTALSIMTPKQIVSAGLLNRLAPLDAAEIDRHRTAWARLMREDAPFRVLQDGVLVSASLTHFDETLLSRASTEWQGAARFVGNLLSMRHDGTFRQCPDDFVLWGRIGALAEAGKLEIRGYSNEIRGSEVRLATRAAPGL